MKQFFRKKCIFAIIFFLGILIFTGWNLADNKGILSGLREELKEKPGETKEAEWLVGLAKRTEDGLRKEINGKMIFTEIYGGLQRVLKKDEYGGFSYIKDEDGMMYYASLMPAEDDYLKYALRVKRAMEVADKKGAKTLFVLPPSKVLYGISKVDRSYPVNDKNAAQDEMLLTLSQCGVPTVDLRDICISAGLPAEELFYKTDHSWTTKAAFLAAAEIVEKIRIRYDDDWDPANYYCNMENYENREYESATVGSFGRNTGVIYSGYDDYTVLTPKFETELIWYNIEEREQKRGSFEEVLVTAGEEEPNAVYGNPGNHIYLEGIVNRDRIENLKNPEGPRLLCLRDSYFSPLASFLAPMCSSIDMVWARSRQNDIDYEKLILEEDYDYLIIENYPYNLDEEAFNYFKE